MSFSQQLQQARKACHMTQQQVAHLLGIDTTTYSGYETGKRKPDVERIRALCGLLHVSPDDLLETGFHHHDVPPNDRISMQKSSSFQYPVVEQISRGMDDQLVEKWSEARQSIPADWLAPHGEHSFFVWQVEENSMYPQLLPQDRILIQKCSAAAPGSVVLLLIEGSSKAILRKVEYLEESQALLLLPANPEYQARQVPSAQCHILGKAVRLIRTLP